MNNFAPKDLDATQRAVVASAFTPERIFGAATKHKMTGGSSLVQANDLKVKKTAGGTTSKNASIPGTHIDSCGPMDILSGRAGKRTEDIIGKAHPGTKIFYDTISRNLPAYQDHSHRNQRSYLIKRVVCDLIAQGCRFVKYDCKADQFLVLNEKQIRDKVSFAFRHRCMNKRSSALARRRKEKKALERTLNKIRHPVSPHSVAISSFSIEEERQRGMTFVMGQSELLLNQLEFCFGQSQIPLPPLSPNETFVNNQTVKHCPIASCNDNDDDQEFIAMIDDLDVDGLSLSEEEVDMTFYIDYELTRHNAEFWGLGALPIV